MAICITLTGQLLEEIARLDCRSDRPFMKGGVIIAYLIYGCVTSFSEAMSLSATYISPSERDTLRFNVEYHDAVSVQNQSG